VRIQRDWVLPAECHPKTADQQRYANRLESKITKPHVSQVALRTTKTRNYGDKVRRLVHPRSLEPGVRSERVLTAAVAKMHVKGLSDPSLPRPNAFRSEHSFCTSDYCTSAKRSPSASLTRCTSIMSPSLTKFKRYAGRKKRRSRMRDDRKNPSSSLCLLELNLFQIY
jgi:hypothetical protein